MKRCSQCDFIYEDDQHHCDMDGHELVYEPTLQPLQQYAANIATSPSIRSEKSASKRQALAAVTAVLIATVLSVGYSGFTMEYAPQNTKAPSTNVISAPQSAPDQTPATPVLTPTPSPSHSPRLENTRVRPGNASAVARSTPRLPSTAPGRDTVRPQPAQANHKKESRVGGFLKKTGKILKRPFKF